jgi:hypothetical protein
MVSKKSPTVMVGDRKQLGKNKGILGLSLRPMLFPNKEDQTYGSSRTHALIVTHWNCKVHLIKY